MRGNSHYVSFGQAMLYLITELRSHIDLSDVHVGTALYNLSLEIQNRGIIYVTWQEPDTYIIYSREKFATSINSEIRMTKDTIISSISTQLQNLRDNLRSC
jgi:hypothetical protein